MAKLKVGINGFGRIGRILFRAGYDKLDVVGINSLGNPAMFAHLLKYDSTFGRFPGEVSYDESHIIINGKKIPCIEQKDPAKIPWKDWGAELVLECTGAFKKKEDFLKHISAGAKRVLVSSPAEGVDMMIVYGINQKEYDPAKHQVISNASCTTNCLAPVAKTINDAFEIEKALMTTVHSYTNDQRVLDMEHKDLRRARGANQNMIPTTTGAAKAVGKVLPNLKGKIDGVSVRVPTPDVSLVDFNFVTKKPVSIDTINKALKEAANGPLKGILACEEAPLVSSDFIGNSNSSIVDLGSTMAIGENMGKVFSWYDNEFGFSCRMIDLALYMQSKGL